MTTTQARQDTLGEATLGELAGELRGELVRPTDPSYDEARSIWNAAHDKRPALIVRCRGVADVIRAVEFARSEGLTLAVRGGGHSIPGFSTTDGGLVIDLSPMNSVRVDPDRRVIVAQGGCVWGDVDAEAQAFGLAVTGGLVSTTGVAGFTLGGGIGWLVRRCGLACDNLVGADVVTADGRYLHTSEDENAELLWALRGGGGNFGVVTSFEFKAHDVGPTVYAGLVFYPGDQAAQVLRGFGVAAGAAPDELSLAINLTTAPQLPFLPEEVHGKPIVAVLGMWSGRPEDGEAATKSFRELAPVVADLFGPMPYTAMQTLLDPLFPRGMRNYFRSAFFHDLGPTTVDALVAAHGQVPNGVSELHVHHLGGAMGRVPADATAFGTRDREFILNVVARTPDADGYDDAVGWARSSASALGPDAASYVNFTGETNEDIVRASYPAPTYDRLVAMKNTYDPTNLFHLNQNIRPTTAS
ncbi:FAD/FMN-containing dehydrogenase [Kribbella sp. VKM Ac-2571]|uniref:FAD-binding oxidoreductase n=1 Tax=Kribbella sp. VKM Ac-2571 TaxID=2512222 RepID=UPI001060DAF1|nr:FAD-binding oxidoreductase [Kribbella sp. VKM Ac-2571]TDO59996.1 FAD/FMN-containing dehydrogenase [Kribbella sp. VKM Ac-2571]